MQKHLESIPLSIAVLCISCNVISDSKHDHCGVCGSASLVNLARLLSRTVVDVGAEYSELMQTRMPAK